MSRGINIKFGAAPFTLVASPGRFGTVIVAAATTSNAPPPPPQGSFDFYISTTGSDANPGTITNPWALTSLQSGNPNNVKMKSKRTGMLPGTYIPSFQSGSDTSDQQSPILRMQVGTSVAPTYLGASDINGLEQPFTTYPKTTICKLPSGYNGNNCLIGINPGDLAANTGWVSIVGIEFDANNWTSTTAGPCIMDLAGNTGGFTAGGTQAGLVIQYCVWHGVGGGPGGLNQAALFISGFNGTLIENNLFYNIHKPAQPDHCHAILHYGCQNSIIRFNTIINCDTGVHAKAGNCGIQVYNNYFYNCPTVAIQGMDGAEGNPNTPNTPYIMHHNIIDSSPARLGDLTGFPTQANQFYNNTIYDPRTGSQFPALLVTATGVSGLQQAYNNIISSAGTGGSNGFGLISVTDVGPSVLDYNCYNFTNLGSAWGVVQGTTRNQFSTLAAWKTATGKGASDITANPQFAGTFGSGTVVAGGGPNQFQLLNTSVCKGAGRIGGVSGGGTLNMGAWDGAVGQIGTALNMTYPGPVT